MKSTQFIDFQMLVIFFNSYSIFTPNTLHFKRDAAPPAKIKHNFVHYLIFLNTVFKNNISILTLNFQKFKNGIEIFVGQAGQIFFFLSLTDLDQMKCCAQMGIHTKDLRGNPKPRISPDRTETGLGSGNILKNIFGAGRGILFRVGPGRGIFLPGYETFSPGISWIKLPFIPKLRKPNGYYP